MKQIVYCIDTETTGFDPIHNDVIEIAMWRLSDDDNKSWLIQALNESTISDKALNINGHIKEDILIKTAFGKENYKHPSDVIIDIENWIVSDGATIEERVFLGQNPKFDFDFLTAMWKKQNTEETFPFKGNLLDTIQLVRFIDFCTGKIRASYSLGNLIKDFDIPKLKAHRAMEDVKMTKDLFLKISEGMKGCMTSFADCYR